MRTTIFVFFFLLVFFQCSKANKYVVGFSKDYPPYNYFNNNNELVGFNVDILNAIKKLYQLDINIKTEEWNKINQELENGTIDAVAGAHYSGGPDHRFLYSRSIINTEHCFLYNSKFNYNFSIEKFRSMQQPIVVLWESDVLTRYILSINPTAKLKFVDSYSQLISLLDNKEVTCAFAQRIISNFYAAKSGKEYILNLNHRILERNMGFKINPDSPELAKMLDNGLEIIFANGEYQKIYDKWIAQYEYKNNIRYTYLRYSIIGTLIILALFLLSLGANYILKSRIDSKTKDLQEQLMLNSKIMHELEEQKLKAIESEKMKTAFLANMSHEIRTPMNGIIGFTDLLKNTKYSDGEYEHFIDLIQQSGYRMLETINNIIDVSKLESGLEKVKYTQIDIKRIFEELHSFFIPEAKNKGLQLLLHDKNPNSSSVFITDEHKINSILTNLIKNALKFTYDGYVKISFLVNQETVDFWIEDTGIGIIKEKQSTIFDQFVQADTSYSREFEGSGLGLSITKGYTNLLGGSISLTSEAHKGTIFHVTIPNRIEYPEKTTLFV